ncbi:MAG: Asp-tRNA(Asn)/Glu-tRNA(Gln) amidotransferase subunit GatB [bacterium]
MASYKPTIGLEIHAELKTARKMFCNCKNDLEEKRPNVNVCPVCLGHPGALPTLNQEAIFFVAKVGYALGGKIEKNTKFDRKNYFYPDLPKGYQISQFDKPIVVGGSLRGVKITRVHLEEDTGRLLHQLPGEGKARDGSSYVDFNRGGVPLMELVTEPEIHSAEDAMEFARELQLLLRYLEVSDADMEKGQMRVEANLSLSSDDTLGTKVEVKNINSFRAVRDAILYEIERQTEVLDRGGRVIQETRGWDENKKITFSQRTKEDAHDYRYFPEPDLPPVEFSDEELAEIKRSVPELPEDKRVRFQKEYSIPQGQVLEVLIEDRYMASYFEASVSELLTEIQDGNTPNNIQLVLNYLTSDVRGLLKERGEDIRSFRVTPENFADLIVLLIHNEISSRIAKDILRKMDETKLDPRAILEKENLTQINDTASLITTVKKVIVENGKAVEDYKNGNENTIKFFIGQAMKELRGRGNLAELQKLFEEYLPK